MARVARVVRVFLVFGLLAAALLGPVPAHAQTGSSDLFLQFVAPSGPQYVGREIQLVANYWTNGPDPATNVKVTWSLPSQLAFDSVASDPRCVASGSTVTCTATDVLYIGATGGFSISVDPQATGDATVQVTIASDQTDPDLSNNTRNTTMTIYPADAVDLVMGLSPLESTQTGSFLYNTGETINWYFQVPNYGPGNATDTVVHVTAQSGMTFTSTAAGATCTLSGQVMTCSLGTVVANSSGASYPFSTTANNAGSYTVTATVTADQTDVNPSNNTASETVKVQNPASADVALTGFNLTRGNPAYIDRGNPFTVSYENDGPASATGVTVTIPLPAGWSFDAADSPAYCSATSTVTCSVGSLGVYSSGQLIVFLTPSAVGSYSLTASIAADQPEANAANNSFTTNVSAVEWANLAVTITGQSHVAAQQRATYTITVINKGEAVAPHVSLVTSWLTTNIKDGIDLKGVSTTSGTCALHTAANPPQVICALGDLRAGSSATVTLVLQPKSGGDYTVRCDTSSTLADPDLSDNEQFFVTQVTAKS